MRFTEKDHKENEIVEDIIKKTESSSIDELSTIFNEIRKYQPILISIFLGYKDVLSDEELDELVKDLIIIWKFFSDKTNIKKIRITENHLKKFYKKNAEFFDYLSGEDFEDAMKNTTEIVLKEMESKAILTALIHRVNEKSIFKKMNQDRKGEFIMELKTLIDCFEDINK